MTRRLPPQPGEWIDRQQPVEFRFEGRTFSGFAGDVLSSALWCNDVRVLGRSFKYHRPRGIYSLSGDDSNVMVEDELRTNLRGDLLSITPGLDVRAVNTRSSVDSDWLNITERFSRFLPVGFYYKAFHTPRRLFRFYEKQMRKVAGLGKVNPEMPRQTSPKDYAFCDVLVVGAGPAGLSAAIEAGRRGLKVLVVDEQRRPGGSLTWQAPQIETASEELRRLTTEVEALDNVELRLGTMAGGCYGDHWIALFDERRLTKLRARSMVVAAGCFEQPAVFQNNDLPGVMLASAAQRLIHLYAVKPLDQAVVLAANSDGYRAALDLAAAGVDVKALVDLRSAGEPGGIDELVIAEGIKIKRAHCIYEAIPARGNKSVLGVRVCRIDAHGKPLLDDNERIDCDGVISSVGWAPNAGLVYQAGGRFRYDESVGQLAARELPAGVFVAGRANGVFGLSSQLADGHRAGRAAARHLGVAIDEVSPEIAGEAQPTSHSFPFVPHKGKKNFVDLDEDLHLADFENAWQEGYDNIELMKRYTTVGMGPSQGKLSNMNAIRLLAQLNDATIDDTGSTTSRPFHRPVSFGHLAGRGFHPQRRTAIHDRHVAADAVMIHAGAWLRPEYYRIDGLSRAQCILQEAAVVRQGVGLIDVSTLGKLHIDGPDAARFLEFIYTGRFAKQPIGRVRYGIACDETGVIIEDGVIVRMADDRFYVTATSGGAAGFYRELQRWALISEMDVVLTNATSHLAAFNLAGPHSREVLGKITDCDLEPVAFPYLTAQDSSVAGAPARLIRVGFVGELGYEIHVPASCAPHVWHALMAAGERHGIRPFGVESQRLLRLEKGHLIVGQDTDSLTNPFEADVAWAIGKNKKFFVGSRSLEIMRRDPPTRQLVGLRFSSDYDGPLPEDCHLIIRNGEMVGRITSVAHQSTLGFALALAFVPPSMAAPDTAVEVRVSDGAMVPARVVSLPFYDPDNQRQQMSGDSPS